MQSIGQELKLSHKASIIFGMIEIVVIGIITILGYSVLSNVHPLAFIDHYKNLDILDSLDTISNNIMMPIAAIFTTILVTGVIGLEKFCAEIKQTSHWRREFIYQLCMCLIVIPCLLVIGWRGEPGIKDEPQHVRQGAITLAQLELLDIPYRILSEDTDDGEFSLAFSFLLSRLSDEGRTKLVNKPI